MDLSISSLTFNVEHPVSHIPCMKFYNLVLQSQQHLTYSMYDSKENYKRA